MEKLKWSVLALAQDADVQRSLFLGPTPTGDELALAFEDGLTSFKHDRATESQRSTLQALDQQLSSLSGEHHADFWLVEENLQVDPRWEEIRSLAKAVASAFGWEIAPPPPEQGIVIKLND